MNNVHMKREQPSLTQAAQVHGSYPGGEWAAATMEVNTGVALSVISTNLTHVH